MTRYSQIQTAEARLIPVSGGYQFVSSYDAGLVAELKHRIPSTARRWDNSGKAWIVDAQYVGVCIDLADTYLGVQLVAPKPVNAKPTICTRLVKLEYLGRTKDRGNENTASGYADGGWTLVFPETALREWFEAIPQTPNEKPTLYAVLAIKQTANEEEIKKAYRQLARQWHPDVCHEADAITQFKVIQGAYEILNDPMKRKKYNAGLALEASARNQNERSIYVNSIVRRFEDGYRTPLRCGWVLCEGSEILGRFAVKKVLEWQDIVDAEGRVMITSWPIGKDNFEVRWQ